MTALGLVLLVPVLMWAAQSAALAVSGRRAVPQLGGRDLPPSAQSALRVATNVGLLAVIASFPLLTGRAPLDYYVSLFPAARAGDALLGLAAAVLFLALLYLAWLATGQVSFEVRHPGRRLVPRLLALVPTAVLVALVEELLFRGVVLAGLAADLGRWPALLVGSLVFAAAHYVRRVKRYWTFPGHVALGVLFSAGYLLTDALWLSCGLHAGGVLMLLGARPFVRYHGPGWLVGASIYPYAGSVGVAALLALAGTLAFQLGGNP